MNTLHKVLAGTAASLALAAGVAVPVFADGAVASFDIHDHGQGCWAGGSLFADGSANGGGNCSFKTAAGQEVASISPESWSFTDSTHTMVSLCAEFTGKKGPVFPIGFPVLKCIPVPVGSGAPIELFGDTYGKVVLHG